MLGFKGKKSDSITKRDFFKRRIMKVWNKTLAFGPKWNVCHTGLDALVLSNVYLIL